MKKHQEKKSPPKLPKTPKSVKAKSPSKLVKDSSGLKKETKAEVPIDFKLELYDLSGTVVAIKNLGTITETEGLARAEYFIRKKDTAVRGKLIKK
jgi:hypothetical protein